MVLISDPAAIKALYTERAQRAAAGPQHRPRTDPRLALGAAAGGRRAPRPPPADAAAPSTASGCAPTRRSLDEIVAAEIDSWPLRQRVPDPLADAGDHPGGDPAGRLRRLRAGRGWSACAGCSSTVLSETASPRAQLIGLATRRFGGGDALRHASRASCRRSTSCSTPRSPSTAPGPTSSERDDILSMLMVAEFEDGGAMSDTELRDQLMTLLLAGHETTATALAWTFDLLLRHPTALQRLRDSLEAGEDDYLRATISESLRLRPVIPLAGRRLAKELVARRPRRCPPAPTSPRRSGSPTPAPTSTPSPSPSAPSASSRTAPTPTPGSPSAAASAAASAPPSPSSRCGSSCARC